MNQRMLAALVITAAALTGCSKGSEQAAKPGEKSGEPRTETIQITGDDLKNDKQISRSTTLSVGDFLQISLPSNPSTGFTWDEKLMVSDPTVVVQTGHEAVAPKESMPGAPGSEVWMVQALAPGNSTVSTSYGRPWEGGEKDESVFSVNVTVK